MEGFFSKKETESQDRPNGQPVSCASCGLYRYVLHPRMEPFGNFKKGILNIGEAPGEIEDKRGRQWQGKTGRKLQHMYRRLGVDLFEDCLNINTINCRPTNDKGNNRAPLPQEVACCRKRVLKVIAETKPKVIILHGGKAVECLIGYRWKKQLGGISKWRGWTIPDRDFNAWICPTFHPSFVERQDGQETETIWEQDLERAFSMVDVPFPHFEDEESQIEIVEKPKEIFLLFQDLMRKQLMAFDIETTGLKPYDTKNHRIVCTSFCADPNKAYVVGQLGPGNIRRLKQLLEYPDLFKIAANMKFEDTWENVINGIQPFPWVHDTMLAGHLLDNRKGITGLKFQVYVQFGVIDYDSEIEEYLKADDTNANSVNRIMELEESPAGRRKLRIYCGMDSLFEYRLALLQMEQMGIDSYLEELV